MRRSRGGTGREGRETKRRAGREKTGERNATGSSFFRLSWDPPNDVRETPPCAAPAGRTNPDGANPRVAAARRAREGREGPAGALLLTLPPALLLTGTP